jgi:DNA replicative helicase MCM subunit Mcm2 (Cdc46/Mcm family)
LGAFLLYARQLKPTMSENAVKQISEFWMNLRTTNNTKNSLPIDKRLYESLYRISTAYAKMYLS